MINKNECVFFYGGYHSQWYHSPFTFNGVEFNCAEQFMMYGKAIYFSDHESAKAILASDDPRVHKFLGKLVENYDDAKWDSVRYNIVLLGTFLKATQNSEVFDDYVENSKGGKTLYVEASPYDKIWGIGLSVADALDADVKDWRGTNLLGKAITEISDLLLLGDGVEVYGKLNSASMIMWVPDDITSIFD